MSTASFLGSPRTGSTGSRKQHHAWKLGEVMQHCLRSMRSANRELCSIRASTERRSQGRRCYGLCQEPRGHSLGAPPLKHDLRKPIRSVDTGRPLMIAPRAEITPASTPRHRFFSSGAPGSNVSARFPDRREWRAQFARLILQDAKLR
jgi:hypothetical protein